MPAYTKVKHQGRTLDKATLAALRQVEMWLGYGKDTITVVQGSYNGGRVAQSAGTHDEAGALDATAQAREEKVRAMREIGFAAWFRPRIPGVWGDHVHGILWCSAIWSRIPAVAQRQVVDARNGRDGLAYHRKDTTGAPILRRPFVYRGASPVSLALMRTVAAYGKPVPIGTVRHRHVSRVRKALKRAGIKLTSPNRTWPAEEWQTFERKVLGRKTPNRIPDGRALIRLSQRTDVFMAQP